MFKSNQKVKLIIGNVTYNRTINYVEDDAVYLKEGGQCFHNESGLAWNAKTNSKIIAA